MDLRIFQSVKKYWQLSRSSFLIVIPKISLSFAPVFISCWLVWMGGTVGQIVDAASESMFERYSPAWAGLIGGCFLIASVACGFASLKTLCDAGDAALRPATSVMALAILPSLCTSFACGIPLYGWHGVTLSFMLLGSSILCLTLYWLSCKRGVITPRRTKLAGCLAILCVGAILVACGLDTSVARATGVPVVFLVGVAFWCTLFSILKLVVPARQLALLTGLIVVLMVSGVWGPVERHGIGSASVSLAQTRSPPFPYLGERFLRWLEYRYPDGPKGPIPVFLVAAEGGGIRAAYWSADRLNTLNADSRGQFFRHTFAFSGVSGGSLGVVTFIDGSRATIGSPAKLTKVIDSFYARDHASTIAARLLLLEPLRWTVGRWIDIAPRDRVFEERLASDWKDASGSLNLGRPFDRVFAEDPSQMTPVLLLNATYAQAGASLVVANIQASPVSTTTYYLFDTLNFFGAPVPTVAQAVHLSARFPIFSPPAQIPFYPGAWGSCSPESPTRAACKPDAVAWATVVDGGYTENSGTAALRSMYIELRQLRSAADKWGASGRPLNERQARRQRLLQAVSFHFLTLRNDPGASAGVRTTAVSELPTILDTLLNVRSARAAVERDALRQDVDSANRGIAGKCRAGPASPFKMQAQSIPILEELQLDSIEDRCKRVADTYDESSLESEIFSLPADYPDCQRFNRMVPLGWSLSKSSIEVVKCLRKVRRLLHPVGELTTVVDYWEQ
jgi:hypothetical protein